MMFLKLFLYVNDISFIFPLRKWRFPYISFTFPSRKYIYPFPAPDLDLGSHFFTILEGFPVNLGRTRLENFPAQFSRWILADNFVSHITFLNFFLLLIKLLLKYLCNSFYRIILSLYSIIKKCLKIIV